MPTFSKAHFISTYINPSSIVKPTKLDSTIKAIINNFKNINTEDPTDKENYNYIIEYCGGVNCMLKIFEIFSVMWHPWHPKFNIFGVLA